jgi:hypothetical protein
MLFSDERITLEADEIAQTESYDEEYDRDNCLKQAC